MTALQLLIDLREDNRLRTLSDEQLAREMLASQSEDPLALELAYRLAPQAFCTCGRPSPKYGPHEPDCPAA